MDLVAHALLGASLARVATPARPQALSLRESLLLGASAAAFPDIDFVLFLVDPLRFLADWHQAPTHSLLLLPVWSVLLAFVFAGIVRRRSAFRPAIAVAALGIASHIAGDLLTVYGTALLFPLSDRRTSFGTTFVIDPIFTLLVLAGLAASLVLGRRWIATAGLALLCGYVSAQVVLRESALDLARARARAIDAGAASVDALPQPFSPFNWKLVIAERERHLEAHVNLAGHAAWLPDLPVLRSLHRLATAYVPADAMQWRMRHRHGEEAQRRELVRRLWADERFAPFRRFAVYPSLSAIERTGSRTCVWFTDLRYDLPELPDTFRYGFCASEDDDRWLLYRLRYFSADRRQRLGDARARRQPRGCDSISLTSACSSRLAGVATPRAVPRATT